MRRTSYKNSKLSIRKWVKQYLPWSYIVVRKRKSDSGDISKNKISIGRLWKNTLNNKNIPVHLSSRLFDQCLIPMMIYGAQACTITKKSLEMLRIMQRAMERQKTEIFLRDQMRNDYVRAITKSPC